MSPTIRFWWVRTSEHDSYIANRDTPGEAPNFSHQGPLRIGSSGWISMGRATAYGATLSLPRVPAKVPSPKPQRPFVLGSGYRALLRAGGPDHALPPQGAELAEAEPSG